MPVDLGRGAAAALAGFALGYLALIASPGPNMFAIGSIAALRGFRGVLPLCVGIAAGAGALALALALAFELVGTDRGWERAGREIGALLLLLLAMRIAVAPSPGESPWPGCTGAVHARPCARLRHGLPRGGRQSRDGGLLHRSVPGPGGRRRGAAPCPGAGAAAGAARQYPYRCAARAACRAAPGAAPLSFGFPAIRRPARGDGARTPPPDALRVNRHRLCQLRTDSGAARPAACACPAEALPGQRVPPRATGSARGRQ